MDIFLKVKGIAKDTSKSKEENTSFHRKLYVAYLNEAFFEMEASRNQSYSTYVLKNGDASGYMQKLPFILSLHDQLLLNEMDYTD